jgi:hypothetical protein
MSRSSKLDVPDRNLFYKYYITENKSLEELKDIFNCSIDKIYRYYKLYGFRKTKEQNIECRRRTNLKKYGVKTVMAYEPIKCKYKNTIKNSHLDNIDTYTYNKVIDRLNNDLRYCNEY